LNIIDYFVVLLKIQLSLYILWKSSLSISSLPY